MVLYAERITYIRPLLPELSKRMRVEKKLRRGKGGTRYAIDFRHEVNPNEGFSVACRSFAAIIVFFFFLASILCTLLVTP